MISGDMMYEDIIQKYYDDIYRWSFAKTRNRFDAEDLTQEIIYQIVKTFSKDTLIASPEKYLWKIAYYTWCNKAKDYVKNKMLISNDLILNQIKDEKIDIEKKIELEEISDKLKDIINTFSDTMKKVVELYYYEDLQVKQISEKMDIKDSLVKYYLFEARNKIKNKFANEMEEYE